MKRWWLWIFLVLSLGINVGILLTLAVGSGSEATSGDPGLDRPGRAANPPPGAEGPPEEIRILHRLADRFGLEGEDRERFFTLQHEFFRDAFQARRQGRALQRELGRELTGKNPDRQRIDHLIDELARARRRLDLALATTILETRELLEEPQEREYLGFVRRLRERMDEGRDSRKPQRKRPRNGPRRRPRP